MSRRGQGVVRRGGHAAAQPADKICAACTRPFAWRKKWARDWDQIRFCSEACRDGRYARAVSARQKAGD